MNNTHSIKKRCTFFKMDRTGSTFSNGVDDTVVCYTVVCYIVAFSAQSALWNHVLVIARGVRHYLLHSHQIAFFD